LITSLDELKQVHEILAQEWEQEKAQLSERLEQLSASLDHSQATLAWTEDQLKNHQDSLQEVLSSASWKFTKPLRALKR
jgi:hypothetical protein